MEGNHPLSHQYNKFNQDTFLDYLIQIRKKLRKVIISIDREQGNINQINYRIYGENKDSIKIFYLPKGSPEFNAVGECCRRGKYDLLISKYCLGFEDLKSSIAKYYRIRPFNRDIVKYILRKVN